jgi:hypothetical protein
MKAFICGRTRVHFEVRHGQVVSRKSLKLPKDQRKEGDCWIRTKEKDPICLSFGVADFKVREGHRLSVFYASNPVMHSRVVVLIHNHDLGTNDFPMRGELLFDHVIGTSIWTEWIILSLLPALGFSFYYGIQCVVPSLLCWGLATLLRSRRRARVIPALHAHIDTLGKVDAARHMVARSISRDVETATA